MDKSSFYDINYPEEEITTDSEKNIGDFTHSPNVSDDKKSSVAPRQVTQGENIMAEVDTTMLSQEHGAIRHDIAVESARLGAQMGAEFCGVRAGQGDIRREQAVGFGDTRYNIAERTGDIRREVANEHCRTNDVVRQEGQENVMATKDARYDISDRITNSSDRISDRMLELRGLVGQRFHEVSHDLATVLQGQATLAKDVELNTLKTQLDAAKNTTYLSDKITAESEKTRDLISDLKYHDLNRGLVERNAELVNCEQDRRYYRDRWDDARFSQRQDQFGAQFAQLQSQIQAFQSQLQETRQGLVNFGTMDRGAGTQSSTSNNVR
jgi:hypothetical protein